MAITKAVRTWEYINVGLILSVLVGIGAFYKFVSAEAKAEAKSAANAIDVKLDQHIANEEHAHEEIKEVKSDVRSLKDDVKSLYQYMLTKRRQDRLEEAGQ